MSFSLGKLIEEKFQESRLTKTKFAELIHTSRSHLYTIFTRDDINTDQLIRISQVLKYNFFQHFADQFNQYPPRNETVDQGAELNEQQHRIAALEQENTYLKEINNLLKEKLEK